MFEPDPAAAISMCAYIAMMIAGPGAIVVALIVLLWPRTTQSRRKGSLT